jgi:predicted glycoside hydrolase/deacetylase ChbG (UPF0249 family)
VTEPSAKPGQLIITADDWGYSPLYNAGIEEVVRAGAVDAVSAMVLRPACEPGPLLEAGVEVGLHLELPAGEEPQMEAPRRQAEAFKLLFEAPPAYIDGHHHCHAQPPLATVVEDLALEIGVPVRSIDEGHRLRLEERGIASPDRLVGRMNEREAVLPPLLAEAMEAETMPAGTTEWVVHPGHSDPGAASSYDRGREEDLALLLRLGDDQTLSGARATHRAALGTVG